MSAVISAIHNRDSGSSRQVRFTPNSGSPSQTNMEKREGKPVPIIPEATIVSAGIVRLVELQEAGYHDVKP